MATVKGEDFWERIENHTTIKIPLHLKNLLSFQELDEPSAYKYLGEADIALIESAGSYYLYSQYIETQKSSGSLCNYYGDYAENPKTSKFSNSEVDALKKLIKLAKEKPRNFWAVDFKVDTILTSSILLS